MLPYHGLPPETRDVLLAFPQLNVHNIRFNSGPTAEMAVSLLLAAAKGLIPADRELRLHRWVRTPLASLDGGTALILGYGAVGSRVGVICEALGMRVTAIRRRPPLQSSSVIHGQDALRQLLPIADAVIICLPLTPETADLIGSA